MRHPSHPVGKTQQGQLGNKSWCSSTATKYLVLYFRGLYSPNPLQNKLDEESLARLKAKAAADKAAGVTRGPDAGEEETIPGGVDVTSSITANVWEVHVKVRHVVHL